MKSEKFSVKKRLKSFRFAFQGLKALLIEEHNARIHFVVAFIVVAAGVVFKLRPYEWIAVIFAIGVVITTEILNSAIENLCDFITPERNEKIKKIKDLAAAGVLISAISAGIIGLIVFLPKIVALVS